MSLLKNDNFLEFIFHPMCRMSEIARYSGSYQETVENLAEHVTEVMMFSYMIALRLRDEGNEKIDFRVLLEKCLLHDIEEVVTGDIPRPTKYATKGVKRELFNLARASAKSLLSPVEYDIWFHAKTGKEGVILRIADYLAVAKKCIVEIDLRGNHSFLLVLKDVLTMEFSDDLFDSCGFKQDSIKYLKGLLDDIFQELYRIYSNLENKVDRYRLSRF